MVCSNNLNLSLDQGLNMFKAIAMKQIGLMIQTVIGTKVIMQTAIGVKIAMVKMKTQVYHVT